jgi:hypothetical protein
MGEREPVGAQLEIAEEEQVEIDRPRPVARAAECPPMLGLDGLAEVEQLLGGERGSDANGGVEEVRLVEDLTDRLGLVERRNRLDDDAVLAEVGDRPPEVGLAVADVRSEPDVAGSLRALPPAQTPSSSSDSRSRERSRVTSTPASCTG